MSGHCHLTTQLFVLVGILPSFGPTAVENTFGVAPLEVEGLSGRQQSEGWWLPCHELR